MQGVLTIQSEDGSKRDEGRDETRRDEMKRSRTLFTLRLTRPSRFPRFALHQDDNSV